MSEVAPTVTVTVTCVAWAVRPGMPSVRPLNMDTAAVVGDVWVLCCSIDGVSAASAAASAAAFSFV